MILFFIKKYIFQFFNLRLMSKNNKCQFKYKEQKINLLFIYSKKFIYPGYKYQLKDKSMCQNLLTKQLNKIFKIYQI